MGSLLSCGTRDFLSLSVQERCLPTHGKVYQKNSERYMYQKGAKSEWEANVAPDTLKYLFVFNSTYCSYDTNHGNMLTYRIDGDKLTVGGFITKEDYAALPYWFTQSPVGVFIHQPYTPPPVNPAFEVNQDVINANESTASGGARALRRRPRRKTRVYSRRRRPRIWRRR